MPTFKFMGGHEQIDLYGTDNIMHNCISMSRWTMGSPLGTYLYTITFFFKKINTNNLLENTFNNQCKKFIITSFLWAFDLPDIALRPNKK